MFNAQGEMVCNEKLAFPFDRNSNDNLRSVARLTKPFIALSDQSVSAGSRLQFQATPAPYLSMHSSPAIISKLPDFKREEWEERQMQIQNAADAQTEEVLDDGDDAQ